MMVLAGHSTVNMESSGGGYGLSAGIGRGHGGIGVNYQGIDLETTGSQATGITLEYAPPNPPEHYGEKTKLIKECSDLLDEAVMTLSNIDKFANLTGSKKPSLFDTNSSGIHIGTCESGYTKRKNKLIPIQSYERAKALWDRTRVCGRCGESFVTPEESSTSNDSFEIPDFDFPGINQKCPHCKSYQWKTAKAFYKIKIDALQSSVRQNENGVKVALESKRAAEANEGGFLKRLGRKFFAANPEDEAAKLDASKIVLAAAILTREKVMERPDIEDVRVCSDCELSYTL